MRTLLLLQYNRENCDLGDYRLKKLQTLFCQGWGLKKSSGYKACQVHPKEKEVMKRSNGSSKDLQAGVACVCDSWTDAWEISN